MINKNKFALLMGAFIGGLHLLWSLLVGIMPTYFQQFLNWVAGMHFIDSNIVLLPFNFWKALLLVLITFCIGTIIGRIMACILGATLITKKGK